MQTRNVRSFAFIVGALGTLCMVSQPAAHAQFKSHNVSLYKHFDLSAFGSASGNDCWGYVSRSGREYALAGLNNKMAVVEITDPANARIVATVAHTSSLWGDMKVYKDHVYHVNESGGGIQVIDLSNIDNGQARLVRTISSPSSNHNIAVDTHSGFLYTCGSRGGSATTVIFDLTDPANPVQVGVWRGAYEHDAQIVTYVSGPYAGRQILFGASTGRGVDIVDVTNKANTVLLSRTPYANVRYCHQVWTEDLKHLYINDETDSINRTTVMDISDLENPVVVGEYSSGKGATDHNNYIRDGFMFEADYHSGLRIFDLNVDPIHPPQVGWFDTYPADDSGGFDGAWSCYPFFPSGTVIISDLDRGLFIVDVSKSMSGLIFEYPNEKPEMIKPAGGTRMRVEVSGRNVEPKPGTGRLHYNDGEGFKEVALEVISENVYDAVFPATTCGEKVQYYLSAETVDGERLTDPGTAPDVTYETLSADGIEVEFSDDFENDNGWTVENVGGLTTGAWERAKPSGGGDRGDPPSDYDQSGKCFVTEDGPGDRDIDDGTTHLISPAFDLTGTDVSISYARWYHNSFGADPNNDIFVVAISNDDGKNWVTAEVVGPAGEGTDGGWFTHSFRVADFVEPTATVRVRFTASDLHAGSVVEAGVDAFSIDQVICGAACDPCDANCDGSLDLTDVEPFIELILGLREPCDACTGDTNEDGSVDLTDVEGFIECLLG